MCHIESRISFLFSRYSKVSDTPSSIIQQSTRRHSLSSSSSNHSSINQKKMIKSDTDEHASTERIVDWLMHNPHTTVNDDEVDEEEEQQQRQQQQTNIKTVETKKSSQTKIIPLENDSSLNLIDTRLKIESTFDRQTMRFRIPNFARKLITLSNNFDPKAQLKSIFNETTMKQEDLALQKQLDERIKLLDQKIDEINRTQTIQIPLSFKDNSLSVELFSCQFNIN